MIAFLRLHSSRFNERPYLRNQDGKVTEDIQSQFKPPPHTHTPTQMCKLNTRRKEWFSIFLMLW